jgi:predicted Zn-dependent protease
VERALIARICMVLAAVAAIVFLGIWLRSTQLAADARAIGVGARTPAQVDRSARLFERASRITPDTQPDIARAFLLIRADQPEPAVAVLRRVVDDEPRNSTAWTYLAVALESTGDSVGGAAARARARRLSPPVK